MRMHTYTGRLVDPLNLEPDDVNIEDIAHHLAHIVRFGGATPVYYSVAEHACRVAALVEHHHGPELALLALHHDDAEAYLGDQIRPLKYLLHFEIGCPPSFDHFSKIEVAAMDTILRSLFAIEQVDQFYELAHRIRDADNAQLAAELRCFWGESHEANELDCGLKALNVMHQYACLPPREAKALFLCEHERLAGRVTARKRRAARIAEPTGQIRKVVG